MTVNEQKIMLLKEIRNVLNKYKCQIVSEQDTYGRDSHITIDFIEDDDKYIELDWFVSCNSIDEEIKELKDK